MGAGMVVSDRPPAELVRSAEDQTSSLRNYLVIRANHFISDFHLPLLHSANMQHISVVHLHVLDFELRLAVNGQYTSIVLLSTLFRVKVCFV